MNFFKRLFQKETSKPVPPMPPWETIVEIMYDKHLDAFCDEVVEVIYSKDKTMRFVVLKNENGLFTYQLEAIYQYDEDEWKYIFTDNNTLPAMWEPYRGFLSNSFFESIDQLHKEMKADPEYKQCFC